MKRTTWIEKWVSVILRSRWPTIIIVGAVTSLAAIGSTRLTIDTSLEAWFLEDDATLLQYKEFRHHFGEDEFVVLAIEADNVFTPERLAELEHLRGLAEATPMVHRATALTNVTVLRRSGRSVRSGPLVERLPETDDEAARLRAEVAEQPLVAGSLVSKDGRAAAILVELARECNTFQKKASVVHELLARCGNPMPGATIRIAGSPVLSDAISRYTQRDMSILTPISFLIMVAAIYLLFGRIVVPLICSTVVGLAAFWVVGLMGLLGIQMNLLAPVLILIILVVGVADSIHIFSAYYQELERERIPLAALCRALRHVLLPCLVTSLTTIAGFLSLLSSQLEPIRRFGALAALGTALAFLLSAFLIPAFLPLLPSRRRMPRGPFSAHLMQRILDRLGHPTPRASRVVLVVAIVILVPAIWSIRWIDVTANPMNYFHEDDPVRTDAEAIDTALGGAASLEFIVRCPNGGLKDLRTLRRLDDFERWLQQKPSITRIMSYGALLKEVDRVKRGARKGKLPRSNWELRIAKNIMERAAPDLLASYVQEDFSLGRISVRVQAADADKLTAQAPEIERKVITHVNTPNLTVQATGFVKLMEDMRSYLIRSQVASILIAFATITLMMFLLFRSWKLALFSMIPNVGPILLGLAFMVLLHISLDPGTVMIATIALGLVVDDTCHFLVRLRRQMAAGQALRHAIAETMNQTGRPIILTSVILATAFATLAVGSFMPTLCFGLVSAFVLLTALVADLVVLPAALLVLHPKL